MKLTGNTILITGGGSGIGRGLAEAFLAAGNTVIIAGRRQHMLDEAVATNPGLKSVVFDVAAADGIEGFVTQITADYPELNIVINNAGIMRPEDLLDAGHLKDAEAEITTNLLGPIRLSTAFMAHLQQQADATIMFVSSGLAFVPLAMTATYCATKAAIHSYAQSLRYQLRDTSIGIVEIAPPGVQTDLMAGDRSRMMPLDDYITETMDNFKANPDLTENLVSQVKFLRNAESGGTYAEAFAMLNPE